MVELSLIMAGQGRWPDAAQLLERAAPLAGELSADEREAAANAFRGFSRHLTRQGQTAQAEQFEAKAEELSGS